MTHEQKDALKLLIRLYASEVAAVSRGEVGNPYEQEEAINAFLDELRTLTAPEVSLVRAFNEGYMLGHHDTVESCFTDIHLVDMDTYHADIVAELIECLAPQPGDSDER